MKRIVSLVLVLVLTVSTIPLFAISASAVTCRCPCYSWPTLSSSAYCEFKATKTIECWRDIGFTTRGTCSPKKSYNAYISKNDICKIIEITENYIKVKYPTPSGERTAYIRRSDLFGVTVPRERGVFSGRVTTYSNTSGSVYGSTAAGDFYYVCGSYKDYKLVIYAAISGNRRFKVGYVKNSDFYSITSRWSY
jgi:hypothetical protein